MEQIAWASGVFEGEGWIRKDKRRARGYEIAIKMSDLDILRRIQQAFNVGNINANTAPINPRHKQLYVWRVCNRKDIVKVLNLMMPFLGERRSYSAANAIDDINQC